MEQAGPRRHRGGSDSSGLTDAEIRCFLIGATGGRWTPDYIGELPYPFVIEMLDHYAEFPPDHVLRKYELGYQGPEQKRRELSQEEKQRAMRRLKQITKRDRTVGMRSINELPAHLVQFINAVRSGAVKRVG